MSLTESDLIASLLQSKPYMDKVCEEIPAPDDGDEIFKGMRKGKSDLNDMDHIIGVSNMLGRQKAKEKIIRSVTFNKTKMLQFSIKALSQ